MTGWGEGAIPRRAPGELWPWSGEEGSGESGGSGKERCPICRRIALIGSGAEPMFIHELSESYLVLHDHQTYTGWCELWLKGHREHLTLVPPSRLKRLMEDVVVAADAIGRVCTPRRMNYACLGNVVGHVHWHVIPRYGGDERDPRPAEAVWSRPAGEWQTGVAPEVRDRLVRDIRRVLTTVEWYE